MANESSDTPVVVDEDFLRSVGGRPTEEMYASLAKNKYVARSFAALAKKPLLWNFGWIPPELRTDTQESKHDKALSEMPKFAIQGKTYEDEAKVDLTEIWAAAAVKQALGYVFPGIRQVSGSCVGAAGGTMIATLAMIEVLRLRDPEQVVIPFWLLPYGRSRFYMGAKSQGEGSLGSTFAKAVKTDGVVDANDKSLSLPTYTTNDMLCWGKPAEMTYSNGAAAVNTKLLPLGRKHLIGTAALLRSPDDVEQALRNNYPCLTASTLIPTPRVEADGEAYGRVSRQGGHQTGYLGVWRHPTKGGRWFKYVNQWGLGWGKRSMCWLPEADVMAAIKDGNETYAFSQFSGFPSQRPYGFI